MSIFEQEGLAFLSRYAHVISGVTWIGLLYYFNVVQTPAFASFEPGPRNEAFSKLVPRALWWFRFAALLTVLFGISIILTTDGMTDGDYWRSPAGLSIATGIAYGVVMFLNVWGVIWPNQKIVIANAQGVLAGNEPDPAAAGAARKSACASRTNTLLSIPMLFFMVATSHFFTFGFFDTDEGGKRVVYYVIGLAILVVAEAIALRAPAVGKPEAWHIDSHRNTIIGGFVITAVLYVVWELLFG
ncbi:MAG: urate hydroxylase PuuD [Acidimicrobiia bacterium]